MEVRKYRVLKVTPDLFLALKNAAAACGLSPIDLAIFAINSTLALFRKKGAKILEPNSDKMGDAPENPLLVQVDLSKINQETLNWLSAEAQRRGCSLGQVASQALEAWFGYISSDDAVTKNFQCPGCGKRIQIPTS